MIKFGESENLVRDRFLVSGEEILGKYRSKSKKGYFIFTDRRIIHCFGDNSL